jgi:serine protease inhibitor
VETSPREFRFATSCAVYRALLDLSQTDAEKYVANFNSLANGEGRLWITDSRVTHSHGINSKEQGAVEWMKFSVEIKLPKLN